VNGSGARQGQALRNARIAARNKKRPAMTTGRSVFPGGMT
jgi:hypothetical protein